MSVLAKNPRSRRLLSVEEIDHKTEEKNCHYRNQGYHAQENEQQEPGYDPKDLDHGIQGGSIRRVVPLGRSLT